MKKRKILRERRKRFKILSAVVALVLAVTLAVGLLPDSTGQVYAAEQSADTETRNNYENSLGELTSTRYNGRVWSDKSVSTEDVTFTGDNESDAQKITVDKDASDFLVTFSTLATSTQEEGVSQVPVDVVFVIDNSNSMEEDLPDRQTRLEATLDAVNSSIATVMTSNAESRVGVVVYGLEAEVLLPLGHYEPMRDGNYITLSGHTYHPESWWEAEGYSTEFTASGNHVVSMDPGERGTNTHMGINAGMGLLANAENIGENNMKHVPALILLSDGASTSSGAGDWWNPSGRTGGGTSTADSYALKVAMNAQYNKQQVNLHYGVEDTASDYACKIYTIGMGIEQLRGDDYNRAQMALDPGTHLTDNNDVANAIERVWNNYRNNRSATLDDYRFRHPSTNDITTIAYNDGYYSAENAEDVTDVFDDITSSIVTSRPQVPTEVTGDNPVSDGYITYTDPIGEYMHVDSMKSLIWAGQEFTQCTRDPAQGDGNGTVTYTFQGEINSPAYGEHNVSEIQIKVTTDQDGKETLEVKVPASAIPLRVNTIRTNADGTIANTSNNAYPLRLVYGVSQNEDVIDENGIIDTNVVTEKYLADNTVNGKVNFYSNLYSENKQGNTTVGDAKVEFTPAESNPFYFMQENTPIYLDQDGNQQVQKFIDSGTYYVPVTYYNGNNQVTTYVGRAASTMVNYVESDDNGCYIKEGAPRLGNIQQFQAAKTTNTTGTAATYIYPTFEGTDVHDGKFVVYLGNNGLMKLDAPASLTIAKDVTADSGLTAPDEDFTFVLTAQSKANSTVTAVIHTEGGQDQEVSLVFDNSGNAQIQGESSTADITLKDGQSIEIPGMANTDYTVQETSIPAGFTLTNAVVNPDSTGEFHGNTVTGTVGTENAQITFTNNYSVAPITSGDLSINLGGTKNITGRDFQQGDSYTFTIAPARATPDAPLPQKDGQDVARVTITPDSGSSANFAFDGVITFSKPGEYRYIIQEDTGDLPGVDYDAAIYRLNIVIVDNGDGRLRLAEPDEVTNTAGNLEYPQNPFIQKWGEGEEVNAISFDNSYSATEATVAIQGIKDFQVENSDRRLADGDFTFRIEALGYNTDGSDNFNPIPVGDPAQPMPVPNQASNIANGNVVFGNMTFTQDMIGNTYVYKVTEVLPEGVNAGNPTKDGITYDVNEKIVKVTVTRSDEGGTEHVVATVAPNDGTAERPVNFRFENRYQPESTTIGSGANAGITVQKTFTGRPWTDSDAFTYEISATGNTAGLETAAMPMPQNIEIMIGKPADGAVNTNVFGEMTFEKAGVYTYTITEKPGDLADKGVTYDTHKATVTVTVTEDQTAGKLSAEIAYDNRSASGSDQNVKNAAAFTNTYASSFDEATAVNLDGTKNLMVGGNSSEQLEANGFYFVVTPLENAPVGDAILGENGSYLVGNSAGSDEDGDKTFTASIDQLLNNIGYSQADLGGTMSKDFVYIITEQIPQQPSAGVTYDHTAYQVTVTVTDNGEGNLRASQPVIVKGAWDGVSFVPDADQDGVNSVVFNNSYNPAQAAIAPHRIYKILSGDRTERLQAGEFSFTMSIVSADPQDGVQLPADTTIRNEADGTVQFGNITFTKAGTYIIQVKEDIPDNAIDNEDGTYTLDGVTYDNHVIQTTFTVRDQGGQLIVNRGNTSGSRTFTNKYQAEGTLEGATALEVTKELTGRDWQEGDSFTFTLTGEADRTGYELPDNASGITIAYDENDTDAEKSANFGDITFTEPGIYEFTVAETEGDIGGIDYDDTQYVVTVEVSDQNDGTLKAEVTGIVKADGTAADSLSFTNTYEPGGTVQPGTGDAEAQLTKELVGRDWLESDQFSFTITADEGTPAETLPEETTVTVGKPESGNSNTFDFGPFTFNAEGEYHYTVREEGAGTTVNGITYSNNVAKITIDVTDNLQGGFAASVTIANATFTNTYSAGLDYGAEGGLNLVKRMDGHDIAEGQFQFQVTPVSGDGYVSAEDAAKKAGIEESGLTVSTDAASMVDGVAVDSIALFNQMKFDQTDNGKTYAYQISEVQETKAGYQYDKTTYTVTISVSDDNNGVLTVTTVVSNGTDSTEYVYTSEDGQNTPAQVVFNNAYDGAGSLGGEGAVSIQADKELLNGQLSGNDFTFIVTDKNEAEVTRGTNDASGKITFNEVAYTTDKLIADLASGAASYDADSSTYTYQYEVTEDTSNFQDMGVIANVAHFNITVTVKDNGDGTLTTAVDYGQYGDGLTFQNTYGTGADIAVNVGGTKELAHADGLTPPDITGAYQFTISGQDENGNAAPLPENTTASNDANGNVSFGAIQYTMENVFGTTAGETASDDVAAGEDGIDTQIAQRTKTYTYTVTESGNVAGVTNDQEASKTFTIVVTDNGDGTLSVTDGAGNTVVPGAQFTFVNTYSVTPSTSTPTGDGGITITKNLEGRALNEGEFTFEMTGLAGTISEGMAVTGTNDAAGNVALGGLEFSRPGTYEFRISEVIPETPAGGVTYDGMTYQATAEVTDNHDGTLAVAWTVKAAADGEALKQVTFTNTYKAAPAGVQFGALKRLDGDDRDLKAGEFTFQVKDESGKVVATAKNKADGSVRFDSITFDKAGTYTYTISEVKGSDETITYDETVYTAIVNVTDDLNGQLYASVTAGDGSALKMTFTNKYTKPAVPVEPDEGPTAVRTGDTAPILPIILVMAAALAAIIAAAAVILRRNRRQ